MVGLGSRLGKVGLLVTPYILCCSVEIQGRHATIGFAASEDAGYITGASLDINGGDLMMPERT